MANTTTINGKTTKKGLADFIKKSVATVKEEGLKSRINYALKRMEKDADSVSKKDLFDLAKEIQNLLTPAPEVVVENSSKPKLGKKKSEPKDEVASEEKTPKTSTKKVAKKQKPAVETEEGLTDKDIPLAKVFPKEIDHESLGKLVACPDKYSTIEEIRKALDDGKTLYFAGYWTKRHIKEFTYGQAFNVPVPKGGFPYDLDIIQTIYVCEGINRIYALSTYTEAMYRFEEEELERVDCKANDGSEFTMRYSSGMEYEIYEAVED